VRDEDRHAAVGAAQVGVLLEQPLLGPCVETGAWHLSSWSAADASFHVELDQAGEATSVRIVTLPSAAPQRD